MRKNKRLDKVLDIIIIILSVVAFAISVYNDQYGNAMGWVALLLFFICRGK